MADECWQGSRVYPVGWEPTGTCSSIPQCDITDRSTSVACNSTACYLVAGTGDQELEDTPTYCPVRT